ncbi:VOC family protein [Microvirga pudoricolor]|uniref:VOC family protein n=1 Tax=Microvirga pudoricolor TaxID=2778729 RepID=UPI00194E9490|nr:VOC family protein [Microvirga pudoricolor]MBM6595780.1 VOC family protein [Microvirga pudoricolor]
MPQIATFLMFEGQAEEAMTFYVSLFDKACVTSLKRYGPGEGGPEGRVMLASFALNGQSFMCIDSPAKHEFTFTPSMSVFITCESVEEVQFLHGKLSDGGKDLMPLGEYPFSRQFAWVVDRFGVSWQIGLMDR